MATLADGTPKFLLLHALAVSTACAVTAAAVRYHRRRKQQQLAPVRDLMLAPTLELTDSGRVADLERFSHYVGMCSLTSLSSFFPWILASRMNKLAIAV